MTINSADLTRLAADLTRGAANIEQAVQGLLVQAGSQVEANARNNAPVKTGRLRSTIRMWVSTLKVVIGPNTPYASFVEYGTGTRGEFPTGPYQIRPKGHEYLRFTINGRVVYTKLVNHPGIAPHPYMRPALTQWVDSLGEDAAKVGVNLIAGPNA